MPAIRPARTISSTTVLSHSCDTSYFILSQATSNESSPTTSTGRVDTCNPSFPIEQEYTLQPRASSLPIASLIEDSIWVIVTCAHFNKTIKPPPPAPHKLAPWIALRSFNSRMSLEHRSGSTPLSSPAITTFCCQYVSITRPSWSMEDDEKALESVFAAASALSMSPFRFSTMAGVRMAHRRKQLCKIFFARRVRPVNTNIRLSLSSSSNFSSS
mmetsp:Transcript_4430/g.12296  ORF Transcript_4430/g.12296 Transcript_4430/m.12296 type:complete len:214 (+) Transcript_4430:500-1141(+)